MTSQNSSETYEATQTKYGKLYKWNKTIKISKKRMHIVFRRWNLSRLYYSTETILCELAIICYEKHRTLKQCSPIVTKYIQLKLVKSLWQLGSVFYILSQYRFTRHLVLLLLNQAKSQYFDSTSFKSRYITLCNTCFHEIASQVQNHYDDVIMGAIASQITSLTTVYSTVYSGADQSKHQSCASLAFVWGIHRGPVNSPHKWQVTRKMFPFVDVIMIKMKWGVSRGSHYWGHYPGPLSCSQVSATHLKIGHHCPIFKCVAVTWINARAPGV